MNRKMSIGCPMCSKLFKVVLGAEAEREQNAAGHEGASSRKGLCVFDQLKHKRLCPGYIPYWWQLKQSCVHVGHIRQCVFFQQPAS